ncbi:MAG: SPOR domain-containing protein [Syntrophobacterales bacterium]|nr:MAG: SPOR domain-containing protein [Syntrophobacterales bacterium]
MGKDRVPQKRLGRVLLSYGIVFFIGLWLGYKLSSTRRTVAPERKEMSESIPREENEGQKEGKRAEGDDKAGGESSFKGEAVQREDLSLTFYETLLKKEPSLAMRNKGGVSEGVQAPTGPRKRGGPSKEDKSSKEVLSRDVPFTIQVGSFAHRKQAEDLTQYLREKGYPAYITSQVISGMGRMYQVRIGRYRTLDEARREAKHIGKREKLPTYIPLSPDR